MLAGLVLDSSLALAWGLPDEHSDQADRLLNQISGDKNLWVPALWWYEIGNALMMAQKRNRIKEADRLRLWQLYGLLPILTDGPFSEAIRRIQELALSYSLSVYDASYLELALRKGLPLATFDRRLLQAATQAGVEIAAKAD
jgi:predicted nucleic acid-binding protein